MAIARIKKIELIAANGDRDWLLDLLQRFGRVQLLPPDNTPEASALATVEADSRLGEIAEAISALSAFAPKIGFLAGVTNLKPFIFDREMKDVIARFPWPEKLTRLATLRGRLKEIIQERERLVQKQNQLAPWRELKVPLADLTSAATCAVKLGHMPTADFLRLQKRHPEVENDFYFDPVSQTPAVTYLAAVCRKDNLTELEGLLQDYRFTFFSPTDETLTVKEILAADATAIARLDEKEAELTAEIAVLSEDIFKFKMVYDHLASGLVIRDAGQNLIRGTFTFSLSGWICESDIPALEREIQAAGHETALFYSAPGAAEDIPVILQNRKWIQPFEFITHIYGMPKYHEIDPTPFLAPFFFLYFGFCVSDVGYGFTLTIFSWLVLKRHQLGPTGTRFWKMFLYCGLSTIVIGALTGSWFGNLPDLLAESGRFFVPFKHFKDSLIVLDSFREPTKLLGIALGFGIIQVWFGHFVAAFGNVKNKRYLDILLDQVPMLIFLFGLTGMAMKFLNVVPDLPAALCQIAAATGAVVLVLTQGRAEKGLGAKFFYGIYNLYMAFSGYLSDVLSYSRLWALGLVTGVMAMTINLLAVNFSRIMPTIIPLVAQVPLLKTLVSILILLLVFVTGHLVSFLMTLLGAFVHPLRLQFVEFFSKFFKSGGSSFKPFKAVNKYFSVK
jgi:V/A-type H+/Na+-transporting ATPase subunit I